jgi:hypothetical protein
MLSIRTELGPKRAKMLTHVSIHNVRIAFLSGSNASIFDLVQLLGAIVGIFILYQSCQSCLDHGQEVKRVASTKFTTEKFTFKTTKRFLLSLGKHS